MDVCTDANLFVEFYLSTASYFYIVDAEYLNILLYSLKELWTNVLQ